MRKYHIVILIILILAYGWLYYQKAYSGPDINDYFRAKSDFHNDTFTFLNIDPEKIVGQVNTFYGIIKSNRIQNNDWVDLSYEKVIYLNKDQHKENYNCISPEVKVTGLVQQYEDFYYFASIDNIYGYQKNRDAPNFGMQVNCQEIN